MLVFGAPALLAAGILAGAIPLGLHMLRRRPADPQSLPTARFLSPEPRSRIRLSAPDQPLLLAIRTLLLLLVGAALARPGWLPRAAGRAEIVLVDARSAGSPELARLVSNAGSRPTLIRFDTAARILSPGDPVDAAPHSDLAAALRAIPAAARDAAGADSIRVTLVSPLAAASWSPGVGALRAAVWPGRIRVLRTTAPAEREGAAAVAPERRAAVLAAAGSAPPYLVAALGASGFTVVRTSDSADIVFVARPLAAAESDALRRRAVTGAVVVLDTRALAPRDIDRIGGTGTLWLADGEGIPGATGRRALQPAPPERVIAAWDDGAPAAVAAPVGSGCAVRVGAALDAGALPLSERYPRLVAALAGGCDEQRPAPGLLDAGARAVLAGTGAEWVPAAAIGAATPVPLGRWVMLLAAAVAVLEWLLSRWASRRVR